ncbi:MAG: CorA family divalent cation transporter [Bacteroidota bacterium]
MSNNYLGNTSWRSYHVFLFPFKWKLKQRDKKSTYQEEIDLVQCWKLIQNKEHKSTDSPYQHSSNSTTIPQDWNWHHYPLQLSYKGDPINRENNPVAEEKLTQARKRFNEFNYFLDFPRESLYDLHQNLLAESNQGTTVMHWKLGLPENTKFILKITGRKAYELKLESVSLNLYQTGVGVLAFHIRNDQYGNIGDILKINQFARRIYPQYLDILGGIEQTKTTILPEYIEISGGEKRLREDFSSYEETSHFLHDPFWLPKHISGLLPKDVFFTRNDEIAHQNNLEGTANRLPKKWISISPVLDDRMFVVSCVEHQSLAKELKVWSKRQKTYAYQNSNLWYQYVFVDRDGPSIANESKKAKILEQATYDHWVEEGTLFGFSRYSLVGLCENDNIVKGHTISMYCKLVELSLVQRAGILRFSDEVSRISQFASGSDQTKDIQALYLHYIQFINKLYFREVTAQEQGIDIYDKIQDTMRIGEHTKDLNKEIQELHQYATLLEENRRSAQANRLTTIATAFLIPTFISGFLGMNVFNDKVEPYSSTDYGIILALMVGFTLIGIWLVKPASRSTNAPSSLLYRVFQQKKIWLFIFSVLGIGLLSLPAWFNKRTPPPPPSDKEFKGQIIVPPIKFHNDSIGEIFIVDTLLLEQNGIIQTQPSPSNGKK